MSSIKVNINGVTLSLGNVKKCASNVGDIATSIKEVKNNMDDQVAARRNIRRRLTNLYIDIEEINDKLERIYAFGNHAMAQYEDAEKTIKDLMISYGLAKQITPVKDIVTDAIKNLVGLKYLKQITVGTAKVVKQVAASFKEAMKPGGSLYKVFQVGKRAFQFPANMFCKSVLVFSPIVMLVNGGLSYYKQQLSNLKTGAITMGKKVTAWFKENVQIDKWLNKAWKFGKAAISSAGKVIKNAILSSVSCYIALKKYKFEQFKTGAKLIAKGAVSVFKKVVESKAFKVGVAIIGTISAISLIVAGGALVASLFTTGGTILGGLAGGAMMLSGANDVISNVWDMVCILDNTEQYCGKFDFMRLILEDIGYKLGGQKGAEIAGLIDTIKDVGMALFVPGGAGGAGGAWDDFKNMDNYAYLTKRYLTRFKEGAEFLGRKYTNMALGQVATYAYKTASIPINFINAVSQGEIYVFDSLLGKIVNGIWRVGKKELDLLSY